MLSRLVGRLLGVNRADGRDVHPYLVCLPIDGRAGTLVPTCQWGGRIGNEFANADQIKKTSAKPISTMMTKQPQQALSLFLAGFEGPAGLWLPASLRSRGSLSWCFRGAGLG